jgi:hypothetical protein
MLGRGGLINLTNEGARGLLALERAKESWSWGFLSGAVVSLAPSPSEWAYNRKRH